MKILDFGCGDKKITRSGAEVVGVDNNSWSNADVIHDLDVFPYPFNDNEFNEVVCSDVLEHLTDIPRVMKELHRITKADATIKIRSPHFSSAYAFIDPTHKHFFSIFSFDFFCKNRRIIPHNAAEDLFFLKSRTIIFPKLTRIVGFLCIALANRFPLRYEQYCAYWMQAENIYIELITLK